jgi:hypothetical protein
MASTAEALREHLGMESPFGEQEPVEEAVTEDTDEEENDEATETDESEEESEDEAEDEPEEDEEKLSQVNENLNRALKEERGLRKESQAQIDELKKTNELTKQIADDAEATIESIREQLKELDMEDLVTIKGKVDPEIREMMAEKEKAAAQKANDELLATFNKEMVSTVNTKAADFNNIDLKNDDQGIALQNMIYMASLSGMDMESAVKDSMERLDRMLKTTLKKRTPPVKPKKKLKSVSKTTKSTKDLTPLERIRLAREGLKGE